MYFGVDQDVVAKRKIAVGASQFTSHNFTVLHTFKREMIYRNQ